MVIYLLFDKRSKLVKFYSNIEMFFDYEQFGGVGGKTMRTRVTVSIYEQTCK